MITKAYIKDQSLQKDGRTYITEIQVDDTLGEQEYFYLAEKGTDPEVIMQQRTLELNTPEVPDLTVIQNQIDTLEANVTIMTQQIDDLNAQLSTLSLSTQQNGSKILP